MRSIKTLLLLATALIAAAACDGEADASDAEDTPAAAIGFGGPSLTDTIGDAQIAALISLINGTEIAASKAVQPKLVMPAARQYAAMLIEDHTLLREAMPSLPGPSWAPFQATTLATVFHTQARMLATLPAGYPFDATFASIQIADHSIAIDSLRRWYDLATDDELRLAIAAAIPVMEQHLERARQIYQQLDQMIDLGLPGPADTVPPTTPPGPAVVPADTAGGAPPDTGSVGSRGVFGR